MIKEFRLPDLGEGLTESEIVAWKVAVGDTVTLNQIIAEVETAKAVVELPSPFAGVVAALHEQPGTVVEVGKPIVSFEVEGDDGGPAGGSGAGGAADAPAKREPNLVGYGAVLEELRPSGPPRPQLRRPGGCGRRARPGAVEPVAPAAPAVEPAAATVPAAPRVRRSGRGPRRRCASWPRISASTSRPSPAPGSPGSSPGTTSATSSAAETCRWQPGTCAGVPAQATAAGAGRAGNPHADQGRAQVHRRRHGRQRVHRAARHGVPDRRRHPDHGAAGEAQGQPRVCRLQAHAADPGVQGRADRAARTTRRSTPAGTRPTRRSSSTTT